MAAADSLRRRVRPIKEISEDEASSASSTHPFTAKKHDTTEEILAVISARDESTLEVVLMES